MTILAAVFLRYVTGWIQSLSKDYSGDRFGKRFPYPTFPAEQRYQPLMQGYAEDLPDRLCLLSEILEPTKKPGIIPGMNRAKDAVSCPGGLYGDGGCFGIAYFTDHYAIGRLAQERPRCGGIRQPRRRMNTEMVHALNGSFNRILDCQNLLLFLDRFTQKSVEGGGLAGTGRACQQPETLFHGISFPKTGQKISGKPQLIELETAFLFRIEKPDYE